MSRPPYPHRRQPNDFRCRCGVDAFTSTPPETWGSDCPIALREALAETEARAERAEAERDEMRRELAEAGSRYRDHLPGVMAEVEPVQLDRPMVMAEVVEPTEVPCRTCRYDTISRTGRHRCRQVFDDGVWRYRCNSLAEMNSTGLPTDRTMRCPGWAPKEPT